MPDVLLYRHRIAERVIGQTLNSLWVSSFSVLKTFAPKPEEFSGRECVAVGRIGKRILLEFEGGFTAAIHPMIAGRFTWGPSATAQPRDRDTQLGLDFPNGRLLLKEFGHKKRAQLHHFSDPAAAQKLERGGSDLFTMSPEEFQERLQAENRTLKRRFTDPSVFDGIGNAYSDEILWEAQVSPVKLTGALDAAACRRLHEAAVTTLSHWIKQLETDFPGFPTPKNITAFRPDFAVHGRAGAPCPRCQHPVQRIVYAENECNYCAVCQNGGTVLADRSLSRLLKDDWPRSIDEWEQKFG